MHHNACVRRNSSFILVFGLFTPRVLADFAVCQGGWGWVSDTLGFSISRLFHLMGWEDGTDECSFLRLPTRYSKTLVKSPVCWRQNVRDPVRSNYRSTSTSVTHYPQLRTNWVPCSKDRTISRLRGVVAHRSVSAIPSCLGIWRTSTRALLRC